MTIFNTYPERLGVEERTAPRLNQNYYERQVSYSAFGPRSRIETLLEREELSGKTGLDGTPSSTLGVVSRGFFFYRALSAPPRIDELFTDGGGKPLPKPTTLPLFRHVLGGWRGQDFNIF